MSKLDYNDVPRKFLLHYLRALVCLLLVSIALFDILLDSFVVI